MSNEDILYFAASIILIDGEVSPQEKIFIKNLCSQLDITQETYSRVVCQVKKRERKLTIPNNPEDRTFLFRLLLQVIFCDGKFSPEEQRILNQFSCKIGIQSPEMEEAIAEYQHSSQISCEEDRIIHVNDDSQEDPSAFLLKQMFRKQILDWKDKYKTRVEEDLTNAFPALELRLKEIVESNISGIIASGPEKLIKDLLEPEIVAWISRYADQVIENAQEDLMQIVDHTINPDYEFRGDSLGSAGVSNIGMDILAPIAVIIAGIGTMTTGIIFGITTFLWFFTMISWPILIGGLAIGGVLNILGIAKLSQLKTVISDRFSQIFIPKIKDALIGKGYEQDKKQFPSLKNQLQEGIDKAASAILEEAGK